MALSFTRQFMVLALLACTSGGAFAATAEETTKQLVAPDENQTENPAAETPPDQSDKVIPDDALPSVETPSTDSNSQTGESVDRSAPPPEVIRDMSKLPEPVSRMRELILAAAIEGDIEKLRSLIGVGSSATTLSIGGLDGDPISYLKDASGDDEGFEILAILLEVLEAGYVRMDAGTENEMFVWPYFFAWPLDKLTAPMKVELFRILTAGDMQDSSDFGGYIFYRVGIRPDGRWDFFVAGD